MYAEKSSTARTGAEEATAAKMRCGNWREKSSAGVEGWDPWSSALCHSVLGQSPLCILDPREDKCGKPSGGRVWGEGVPVT